MTRVCSLFLASLLNVCAFGQRFSIVNPIDVLRTDELIVLTRSDVEKRFPKAISFKTLAVLGQDGRYTPLQTDDLDGDGKWDEAAFLCDMPPNATLRFELTDIKANAVLLYPRAHVRLRKKMSGQKYGDNLPIEVMPPQHAPTDFSTTALPLYLTEGPAWENDKVAFRQYFDTRNARDIFGKTTAQMMMDTVGTDPGMSYHTKKDWGMDILKIGDSPGAGGLLFRSTIDNKKLERLSGEKVKKTVYKKIADGPMRAIFAMEYEIELYGKTVNVIETTQIWGGQYFYESNATISGLPANTVVFAGMANPFKLSSTRRGRSVQTHGIQSENNDILGMALLTNRTNNTPVVDDGKILLELPDNKFRSYACWEQTNARFKSREYFEDFIEIEEQKMLAPTSIRWE
ncbi:MAG: DUF4861 domain-containing protein [Proteobacteria bacterium]|nr:MAG: DUF4861 domain-containing protein [Pseudomonadota bacterium]